MTPDFVFLSLAHHLAQPKKDALTSWMTPTFGFANLQQDTVPGWETPFAALLDAYKKQGLVTEDASGIWSLTPRGQQLASSAIAVTTTTVTTTTSYILQQQPPVALTPPGPSMQAPPQPAPSPSPLDENGAPRPLFFRSALLRVVAQMAGGQEGVPVKIKHAATEAIRLTGYDPADKLLQSRVRWAIQNMQVDPNLLLCSAGYGQISLTAKGLAESRLLPPQAQSPSEPAASPKEEAPSPDEDRPAEDEVPPPPSVEIPLEIVKASVQRLPQGNETAQWFAEHLQNDGPLMQRMRSVLRRRLPLSAQYDFIEDHIHNFVLRSISRNSLAALIAEGNVPYNKVVAYCVNSGLSDVRDSGTKPVMREIFKASTARERATERTPGRVTVQSAILATREEGLLDIPDSSSVDEVMRANMWRKIRGAFGTDPDVEICCRVLRYKADGMSNKEIALVEAIPTSKAGAIFRHARKVLRRRTTSAELLS